MRSILNCQDGTNSDSGEEWTMCVQTAELYVEQQMVQGWRWHWVNWKMGKTTGCGQIPADLVKEGGKELKKVILNSF